MTKCYYTIRKFFLRFSSRNYNISIKRAGSYVKYHVMGRTERWSGDRRPILQIIALGRQLAKNKGIHKSGQNLLDNLILTRL